MSSNFKLQIYYSRTKTRPNLGTTSILENQVFSKGDAFYVPTTNSSAYHYVEVEDRNYSTHYWKQATSKENQSLIDRQT